MGEPGARRTDAADSADLETLVAPVATEGPPTPPYRSRVGLLGNRLATDPNVSAVAVTSLIGQPVPAAVCERFELLSMLGRGGMGVVMLARDRRLVRLVALKLLHGSSPRVMERLEEEAKLLASLEHDNIVRVYDLFSADNYPVLVMEYVRGQTLALRMRAGRPSIIQTTQIVVDMLQAIEAAHERRIVHRDLKPANIFLEESGRAKVADFGLARAWADISTRRGVSGTPGYMSPEQAQAQDDHPAMDVYALGVMLYELLTGQRLFPGRTREEVLEQQLAGQPPPPSSVNPSVPPALDLLVLSALRLDAGTRPSAGELRVDLSRWLKKIQRTARKSSAAGFPASPYKLLMHFGPDDAPIFHGRQTERLELVELIEDEAVRVLFLFGPCGIGKSSLVHSGLVPALDEKVYEALALISGPDPAGALRQAVALRAHLNRIALPDGRPVSVEALATEPDLVLYILVQLMRATGKAHVIILDQLEEVFTQNPPGSPRVAELFHLVTQLVGSQVTGLKLVLSYRSEFHAHFFPLTESLSRFQKLYPVRQITEAGLVEAIEGPSRIEFYGFHYERGLAQRLARDILDTSQSRGETPLPVMQIICHQLHERMKARGETTITVELYETALGGASAALERYIEARLSSEDYAHGGGIARHILKVLTVKEETGERFSCAWPEDELLNVPDQAAARLTLERLVADHLVIRYTERDNRRHVRLASEVICRLVDGWQLEPDDTERAFRLLDRHHREWVNDGRDPVHLLSGEPLLLVAAKIGSLSEVTPAQRHYVELSLSRHRRQQLWKVTSLLSLAGILVVVFYLALLQPGELTLNSDPAGATVHVAGRLLGRTPLVWRTRPGIYTLSLRKDHHQETRVTVRVPPGGRSESNAVMPYVFGFLQVSSDPPGARCELTLMKPGEVLGGPTPVSTAPARVTPFTTEVAGGTYRLSLSHPGYLPRAVGPVTVLPNRSFAQPAVRLEKNSGWLRVGSAFDGVFMKLRRADTGALDWEGMLPMHVAHELPARTYLMECGKAGHVPYTRTVELTRATTTVCTAWVPPVRRLLEREFTEPIDSSPAVADLDGDGFADVVVGCDDGMVHAVSGRSAATLWSYATGAEVNSSPALSDLDGDGTPDVVIGSRDRKVHAVSGRTGQRLWEFATEREVDSSAALADLDGDGVEDAVVGSQDEHVYAIAGRTGALLWKYRTRGPVRASPALADITGDGVPDALVASRDHHLHALDGKTGALLWQFRSEGAAETASVADLDRDGVPDAVFGSADQSVYAVSGKLGTLLWSRKTEGRITGAPALAALDSDRVPDVVVGSGDGKLYALSGTDGHPLWVHAAGSPIAASPQLADVDSDGTPDAVVGTGDDRIQVISGAGGTRIWEYPMDGRVAVPALADINRDGAPEVIVGSGRGQLIALSSSPGTVRWAHELPGEARHTATWADADGDGIQDAVVATSGRVHAVSGKTGLLLWERSLQGTATASPLMGRLDGDALPDAVVACDDRRVVALSGRSGKPLWSFHEEASITASALVDRGPGGVDVVIGHAGRALVAISGRTGTPSWKHPLPAVPTGLAAGDVDGVAGSEVLATCADGSVHALPARAGPPLWSRSFSDDVRFPVLCDVNRDGRLDVLVVAKDRQVVALEGRTGETLWSRDARLPICAPAATGDLDGDGHPDVILASSYRRVIALGGKDGAVLWEADTPGPLPARPTLDDLDGDGHPDVLVGCTDSSVHALSGRSGLPLFAAGFGFPMPAGPVIVESTPRARTLGVAGGPWLLVKQFRWPFTRVEPSCFTAGRRAPSRH